MGRYFLLYFFHSFPYINGKVIFVVSFSFFLKKVLEKGEKLEKIRVDILNFNQEEFYKKHTTKVGGTWVFCRQNKHLCQELKNIMKQDQIELQSGFRYEAAVLHSEEPYEFW